MLHEGEKRTHSGMRPNDIKSAGSHWSSRRERSGCFGSAPPAMLPKVEG